MNLTKQEKDTLKQLGRELAEIAALDVHKEKAELWRKLNDLESQRPMVWINEIPWHEMNVDDELTLQCEDAWARDLEQRLRRTLYQWRHMPGDMVVSEYIACPLVINNTRFGITEDVDVVRTDESSGIVSRHFNIQIKDWDDLEKIKMPIVTHDQQATQQRWETMCELYDGIMPVRKEGYKHTWFAPWDMLIRWYGIQEAMIDLIERPDFVHAAVDRVVDAYMTQLDQMEEQNLLSLDCNNTRIGSGGYGYTRELPGEDYDPDYVRPHNMWGCSNAQIFSEVSPQMHWDFAIKHDLRWLERWKLTYYGCCEPLDSKMEYLRRIPNLRKISASPWVKTERTVEEMGDDYVISRKPSPAILAEDNWRPQRARQDLREFLQKTRGKCHVEVIMKDISTVRYEPQRLWEWEKIAMEEVERCAT